MSTPDPPRPPAPPASPTQVLDTPTGPLRPWWQHGWGVSAIAIVALLIGIGIGAAASSSSKSTPPAPTPAQLAAQAEANKAREHRQAVEEAKEAKETATSERAAARKTREEGVEKHREEAKDRAEQARQREKEQQETARKKAEETKTYSGHGGQNIGNVNVPTESTLRWECACTSDNFQIFNKGSDANSITVNALNQTSGETHLDEGMYHDVLINTEGESWTIRITPNE